MAVVSAGMTAAQRAFLDAQVALSAWRAAKDVEAQVAHWLVEGRATREELVAYRARTRAAHQAHRRAQRLYARACESMPKAIPKAALSSTISRR